MYWAILISLKLYSSETMHSIVIIFKIKLHQKHETEVCSQFWNKNWNLNFLRIFEFLKIIILLGNFNFFKNLLIWNYLSDCVYIWHKASLEPSVWSLLAVLKILKFEFFCEFVNFTDYKVKRFFYQSVGYTAIGSIFILITL